MVNVLMILFGIVLTAGTGIFVAAEFALVTLDPTAVDREVAAGNKRAVTVRKALSHLSTELSGAQVGITITTILLGYTTQPALAALLEAPLEGTSLSPAVAGTIVVIVSLILVNGFSMLFGELVPKNLALSVPMRTAEFVSPIQRAFTAALRPLIVVLNGSANLILGWFGVELREELSGGRSAQELASLVRRSAQAGTLDSQTARLLTRSIEFGDLTAIDVMTDRTQLVVVKTDDTATQVIELARQTGHSRFPVIGQDRDDILGLVNLRRAIAVPFERRSEVPATALMIEVSRVPETVRLGPLLVELRGQGLQMAVVVDEYGGTSGMVTLEDVVEEIVGDVADEHDRRRPLGLRLAADGSWRGPGTLRPDEIKERTGLVVPEDPSYETIGGFLMSALGRIPRLGDMVPLPGGGVVIVEQMDDRRVDRVRLYAVPPDSAPTTAGGKS